MTKEERINMLKKIKECLMKEYSDLDENDFNIDEYPDDKDFEMLSFSWQFLVNICEKGKLHFSFDKDLDPGDAASIIKILMENGFPVSIDESHWICPDCGEILWGDDIEFHQADEEGDFPGDKNKLN